MNQLDKKAVWSFFITFVLRNLVPVIFLSFWGPMFLGTSSNLANSDIASSLKFFYGLLWILIPTFFILCFVWARLTYHFYRYELIDAGFRKELGVIYKKYVTIPYDRIQNVDINRGILDRILGLSVLSIQTAGVGTSIGEGKLPGLSREVAEQLRDELIQRARQSRTATTNQGL